MQRARVIAIDVREACQRKTGKGQWTRGCVDELLRRAYRSVSYTDSAVPAEWKAPASKPSRYGAGRWHLRAAAIGRRSDDIAAYISLTSYIVPALIGGREPCVPVVHDLIAFRDEPHDRKARTSSG